MSDTNDPPSTGSLWGAMLGGMSGGGLGALMKLVADPGLRDNAQKAMQAIVESHFAVQRIEAKLDLLLRLQGHDPNDFAAAAVPVGLPDGAGRAASAAGQPVDDGAGGDAASPAGGRHRPAHRPALIIDQRNGGD